MKKLRPFLWLSLVFFLPSSILSAQGVVVEAVAAVSGPEMAGVREGDVFHAWTRLANPPIHPEPDSGKLESPFDWQWMEIEQAPRGTVELRGERQGEPLVLQVPIGLWEAQVRPVLPAELEDLYRRGKELVDQEKIEEGVTCWQQLAERARESENWRLPAWIWMRIATALDKADSPEKAATAYDTALRESRDPLSRIMVLDAMGRSFEWQQRLDEAEAIYRSSLELKEATWGESLQVARSKRYLGSIAWYRAEASSQRHHWAAVEEQIEGALAIEEKWAPGGLAVARSLHDLGEITLQQKDWKKAVTYFDRSLSISRVLQPVSPALAETLLSLGRVANIYGEKEKAEPLYQQALSALGQAPPPSLLMTDILNHLGDEAWGRGDWVEAEDYYQRSLLMMSKLAPESPDMWIILNNLGVGALSLIDLDSAEEYFKRALDLLQLAPGKAALILAHLGRVAGGRGDFASAERYLREALALLEQNNLQLRGPGFEGVIWENLGHLAMERGDLAAAENYFQRIKKIESLVDLGGIAPFENIWLTTNRTSHETSVPSWA
jgi:tetratricopeptide (TPR) repeat protein